MLESSLKLLKKIEENGFKAYIVGGFVRDYILDKESADVDITTSATPKDIRTIFKDSCLPNEEYGSVTVILKNIRYEITTFRKEYTYLNNRKPIEFEYITNLEEDLKRRDFLMNTLCMDKDGNIIDLFNARSDIEQKIIHTVGNSYNKFSEDVLRILRAIRFATQLNFKLSDEVKEAINLNKYLLKNLSYNRKREELDKIFTSKNVEYGISLLLELGLDEYLELPNLKSIKTYGDLLGIWTRLDNYNYPFTKNELEIMKNVKEVLLLKKIDNFTLYKYGLYINNIVADINNFDKKLITKMYDKLPIKTRKDININGKEIIEILNVKPSNIVSYILSDIEEQILLLKLENDKENLIKYVENNYK